ncbi:MAG: sensor histidine kinase [Ruminococcaceae bacterium]|nr:sensor histidine kinase [Oscillospiraceae bacterium]
MTDTKEKALNIKHKTLYIGLIFNIILGILAGVVSYALIRISGYSYVNNVYLAPERITERREGYVEELREFVRENELTIATTDRIAEWSSEHTYVFVIVYNDAEGEGGKATEFIAPIPEGTPNREQLIAEAEANGFYEIQAADGALMIEVSEFTQDLYYDLTNVVALVFAALVLAAVLISHFSIIIKRIKRVASDVTIVSQVDMDYKIESDGNDEIASLARDVELMRKNLLLNVSSAEEVRVANNELIAALSHDIRTPLTVLLGYLDMMKEHEGCDEVMMDYILASENTAMRLKQLSNDMFKYSVAFGNATDSVALEEYDALTLIEQMLSEHIFLLRDGGYQVKVEFGAAAMPEGTTVRTDAQNLMRIIDNLFSNLRKYADKDEPIVISTSFTDTKLTIVTKNKIATYSDEAESNGIGLKSCVRLSKLVADKFEYSSDEEYFTATLVLNIEMPKHDASADGEEK